MEHGKYFEENFKDAVKLAIGRDDDRYEEVKYSDSYYFHVQGHPDGGDSFEVSIIVPHDTADNYTGENRNVSFGEIDSNSEKVYQKMKSLIEEVVDHEVSQLDPYLLEVVDRGEWKRDASVYSTPKIEP